MAGEADIWSSLSTSTSVQNEKCTLMILELPCGPWNFSSRVSGIWAPTWALKLKSIRHLSSHVGPETSLQGYLAFDDIGAPTWALKLLFKGIRHLSHIFPFLLELPSGPWNFSSMVSGIWATFFPSYWSSHVGPETSFQGYLALGPHFFLLRHTSFATGRTKTTIQYIPIYVWHAYRETYFWIFNTVFLLFFCINFQWLHRHDKDYLLRDIPAPSMTT